jgi:hypothetical protein
MGSRALTTLCGVALVAALVPPACSSKEQDGGPAPTFDPSLALRSPDAPTARGLLSRRGIIHAHSVYSHDACDGAPRDPVTGAIDAACLEDFRRDLCRTRHDFVMLTEHDESFSRTDFRELLLFDAGRGDRLIERGGKPVASWMACPDAPPTLLLAGAEVGTMPVGLEEHVAATEEERSAIYRSALPEDIEKLRAAGAVTLVPHTEDWTVDDLVALPLDGFEMYNLHANTLTGAGGVFELLAKLQEPELLPHPDLVLLPIVNEDARYLERWGSVLDRGVRRVTVMGTDCHRNTFKSELPDGERIDSYRRTMSWFSNHLLVAGDAGGAWDDRALKDALRAGRLYGAFEVLGHPVGFDVHAESASGAFELGAELQASDAPEIVVAAPTIAGLSAGDREPELLTRLLRARTAGWDVVAESAGDLRHAVTTPGAYRVEIRMRPRHLDRHLRGFAHLAEQDFVWIYANPIYVR